MEHSRFLDSFAADFARLRAVGPQGAGAELSRLDRHRPDPPRRRGVVAQTLAIREGAEPDPWPPEELASEEPLALLDRAPAGLRGEFAARKPGDPAGSWYTPDQTVGFWIRRMAQEAAIHRIDAELGAGQPVAPVPADLAIDGMAVEPRAGLLCATLAIVWTAPPLRPRVDWHTGSQP